KKADFKVLVVDDSKTARMVIQDLLKSLSIEYESMESAVEAYDNRNSEF
ncbi:MAG: hypothetical protein HQM08_23930, partial [Candidatus Riflebacteria bacterium]|nr:hypothetical protein [Candidatus Riflebacteria bacterium]